MTCQTMSSPPDLTCTSTSCTQTALLYPAVESYANALLLPSQLLLTATPYFAASLSTYSDSLLFSQLSLPALTILTLDPPQLTTIIYLPPLQPITELLPAPLPTAPQPTRAQLTQNPSLAANPLLSLSLEEASGYASRPNPWL